MVLYGFYINDCVYESADFIVSLHKSESKAYEALNNNLKEYQKGFGNPPSWKTWTVQKVKVQD